MSRRLDTSRTAPDILDCIANLSSDEVFTPPRLANQMLDLLPKEVWTNPDLKWLDPGCKTGVFLREIAKRLMDHLGGAIPDEDARREHIYKNMLYGLPITELTSMLSRRSVYYSKDADSERYAVVRMGSPEGNIPLVETKHAFKGGSCVQCGAPESLERGETRENYAYPFIHPDQLPKGFKNMKFDVIVGNPPYQINDGGHGSSASPVYQKFVEAAVSMDPKYVVMIVPSRWFAGGKGLSKFRADMLADKRIRSLVDYPDAADCFPGVNIQGGVNYFLWDRDHRGDCSVVTKRAGQLDSVLVRSLGAYDVFVRLNESVSILEKVRALGEPTFDSAVSARKPFGLPTNFKEFEAGPFEGAVRVYATKRQGWIHRSAVLTNADLIDKFKVLIPKATDGNDVYPLPVLVLPVVASPGTCCTETYLVCGATDSEVEAENVAAYMRTRFFRFLLSLRKHTLDNTQEKFAFVPSLDMTVSWTDEMLYARYGLSEDEVLFIKSQIREMYH